MLLPVHSHRDSDLEQPLVWALEHRFASIEADVWFIDGELRIGHDVPDRILDDIYLQPLMKAASEGRIASTVTLLVDIKNAPIRTYRALHRKLNPHRELLTRLEDGQVVSGPVRILLSGERPIELATQATNRLVFLDGRLPDIGADTRVFSAVSLDWGQLYTWNGLDEMPHDVEQSVRRLVAETHAVGQTIRFWGTREDPTMWATLLNLDVDLIRVDDVEAMTEFLAGR
jgi:hypothetical protein